VDKRVCVCVRENEKGRGRECVRDREGRRESIYLSFSLCVHLREYVFLSGDRRFR